MSVSRVVLALSQCGSLFLMTTSNHYLLLCNNGNVDALSLWLKLKCLWKWVDRNTGSWRRIWSLGALAEWSGWDRRVCPATAESGNLGIWIFAIWRYENLVLWRSGDLDTCKFNIKREATWEFWQSESVPPSMSTRFDCIGNYPRRVRRGNAASLVSEWAAEGKCFIRAPPSIGRIFRVLCEVVFSSFLEPPLFVFLLKGCSL